MSLISLFEIQQLAQIVNAGGVVVLLLIGMFVATVGAYREWWIAGPTHRREVVELVSVHKREVDALMEERNAWRSIALKLTNTAERSVSMAESQLGVSIGPPGSY